MRVYTTQDVSPSTDVGRAALSDATASYADAFTITMLVFAGVFVVMTVAAALLLRSEQHHGDVPEHLPARA